MPPADIEFDDLRDGGDLLGGHIIEAVAGMDFQAGRARKHCARHDPLPFGFCLRRMAVDDGVAPGAGVNFDHRRAQRCCHLDLPWLGGDE